MRPACVGGCRLRPVFVRTVGGMSHVETEAIDRDDVTEAARVPLGVVRKLAEA